jgi:hypothetical protein
VVEGLWAGHGRGGEEEGVLEELAVLEGLGKSQSGEPTASLRRFLSGIVFDRQPCGVSSVFFRGSHPQRLKQKPCQTDKNCLSDVGAGIKGGALTLRIGRKLSPEKIRGKACLIITVVVPSGRGCVRVPR